MKISRVHIKKFFDVRKILRDIWANKRLSALVGGGVILFFFAMFNPSGIIQRMMLENRRKELFKRLEDAEAEKQSLRKLSAELDTSKKAIEKVARERYGMIRPGDKVFKVIPPK